MENDLNRFFGLEKGVEARVEKRKLVKSGKETDVLIIRNAGVRFNRN